MSETGGPIELVVLTERPAVRNDTATDLDVVVEIRCRAGSSARESGDAMRMNLCVVIDRSASMNGRKLETAKRSCLDILGRLAERDLFTVVVFDGQAEVVANPQMDRATAQERIRAVGSRGNTNLSLGWYLGLLELQTHTTDRHYNRLFLLSDGQANAGETKRTTLAREAAQSRDLGITTSTIGIGDDFNEDLLEAIASGSGGRFWSISESRLEDIIEEEFSGALSTTLDRPRVELTLPDGVVVEQELNMLKKSGNRYRIRPLKGEDMFNFAVRLSIDPKALGNEGTEIGARLYDADTLVTSATAAVEVLPVEQAAATPSEPLVVSVVSQYTMTTSDEEMLDKLDSGDMNLMKRLLIAEVEGMRHVTDALEAEQDTARVRYELRNLTNRVMVSEVSMELTELLEPFLADPDVTRFVSVWRKGLRQEYQRSSIRDCSVRGSDEGMVVDLVARAITLGGELAARYPDDAETIGRRVEALREYLARL
ncbi:VWA domain-containing protein [Amycolatopsis sp. FBCC-B4732]|uniref:vWA domain-containing protein n=1 Tax=Amycolatopsis sp. FBCC-B4732 TaxID=3079339 RepID=UPI001FF183DD|nr:VWA domain-containing protein [Amycolatopsis sp. FBCC-B4732]UOX89865.1 VWA domain-containing protein [Amycolatopsis sp. FBCC-B4732]